VPGGAAIYLGDTAFARAHGIISGELGAEESILRSVGGSLIVTGGRPRGTLYAVYELLENTVGCRWYTPWCEKVPSHATLTLPHIDRRVKPYYIYRDNHNGLGDERMYADHEGWIRFVVRNRLNGAGPSQEWGGGVTRGRAGNHSFVLLVPTEKYFKDHPEYFSERKGKRVPSTGSDGNHLCLTNPDVLRIVIEEVKKDLQNYPNATYISVSIGDGGCETICDCSRCRAVAEREGESGLLLQFVNAVADAVKDDYPDKYILTLAYNPTAEPPKRIRARDNVIVFMCRGRTALVHFPTGRDAEPFRAVRACSRFARYIWVWDYSNAIGRGMHFFRPMTWQMHEQFQYYRELATIDGMFQENEFLGGNDVMFTQFYEMNMWIFARLCQNPDQNLDLLIDDFLTGYYGKAAPALRRYVELLKTRVPKYPYRMFSYDFTSEAQQCFDEAEAAVGEEPELLERVKDLRFNLDLATVAWRNDIIRDYLARGGRLEDYPFRLAAMKGRLLGRLESTQHPYLLAKCARWRQPEPDKWTVSFQPVLPMVKAYVNVLCSGKEYAPLPQEFRSLPAERVIDLTGATFAWNASDGPRVSVEPEAALGLAVARMSDSELPMPIGAWRVQGPRQHRAIHIAKEDILGPGYHWYRGPRITLGEATYVYLTESRKYQVHLWSEYDPANAQQQWDVYVSMKATGPAYPHARSGEPNGIYFDRMILVPVGPGEEPVIP